MSFLKYDVETIGFTIAIFSFALFEIFHPYSGIWNSHELAAMGKWVVHFCLFVPMTSGETIEIIDIECVLPSFFSKNFISTIWQIFKGIFGSFRLPRRGISHSCKECGCFSVQTTFTKRCKFGILNGKMVCKKFRTKQNRFYRDFFKKGWSWSENQKKFGSQNACFQGCCESRKTILTGVFYLNTCKYMKIVTIIYGYKKRNGYLVCVSWENIFERQFGNDINRHLLMQLHFIFNIIMY